MLYLVGTPIGNLGDITYRAVEVLAQVDLIAAEDTRRTAILLKHYSITTPTTSFFDFNKEKKTPQLMEKLLGGASIAIVSDAGTPGISDPAFFLVRAVLEAGVKVEAIPGPTAVIAALIVSGLPTDRFVFEGFLPAKKGRKKRLDALVEEQRTIVLYESPQRVPRTLRDLLTTLGERKVVIARELTKKFEQIIRGDLSGVLERIELQPLKGEIVIVLEGYTRAIKKLLD